MSTKFELFRDDLTEEAKERFDAFFGPNGNYDVFPFATFEKEEEEEDEELIEKKAKYLCLIQQITEGVALGEPNYDSALRKFVVALPAKNSLLDKLIDKMTNDGWIILTNSDDRDLHRVILQKYREPVVAVYELDDIIGAASLSIGYDPEEDSAYVEDLEDPTCNMGGDPSDNCAGCMYSNEYHCVDGVCVKKE